MVELICNLLPASTSWATQQSMGSNIPIAASKVIFDYSGVAVELWYKILLAVIDVPYLLDTLPDTEIAYWRSASRYHDSSVYAESESQRKTLRLVCYSWRIFADENRHRWITYDSMNDADQKQMKDALEVIQSITANSEVDFGKPQSMTITSRPRRIMFRVATDESIGVFRTMVENCLTKVTTLFVRCLDGYEDQIFQHLTNQGVEMPQLRCLAIQAPKRHHSPLQTLSEAFPGLVTLTIHNTSDAPYSPSDTDSLLLPDLKMLSFDLSIFKEATLKRWSIQGLLHLGTRIGAMQVEDTQVILDPIRIFGANLMFMEIFTLDRAIRLPAEFWAWCPCLKELQISFSGVYFDTPAPTIHPLKSIFHRPRYDFQDNRSVEWASHLSVPVLINNLKFLPPNFKSLILSVTWSSYWIILGIRYSEKERRNILVLMNNICQERAIEVEDKDKVTLRQFLAEGLDGRDCSR